MIFVDFIGVYRGGLKTRQVKRASDVTKNEMIQTCLHNALKFRFVLMDSWFSSKENFEFIASKQRHFIGVLKSNRLVALSEEDHKKKRFVRIDELNFPEQAAVQGWLKDYATAVRLVRQVFKNKDGNTGILHLVCSDLTCDYDEITTTYKKRWQVEVFHKSLKSNAGLAKSPTQTIRSQGNHVFMAIYAVFKLQCLSIKTGINPFALRLVCFGCWGGGTRCGIGRDSGPTVLRILPPHLPASIRN